MSVAQVKQVTNRVYQLGNKHLAGQHSLTMGELVCFGIAAVMVFLPDMWKKIPVVGKYGSAMFALGVLLFALVMW